MAEEMVDFHRETMLNGGICPGIVEWVGFTHSEAGVVAGVDQHHYQPARITVHE